MNMQALCDSLSAQWQEERSNEQLTLGRLIEALESMPKDAEINGIGSLDSYRGYYADLAFEPNAESRPVSEILDMCRAAMGNVFTGYKGGEYVMGAKTPLWIASYGCCGDKMIFISESGVIETAPEE